MLLSVNTSMPTGNPCGCNVFGPDSSRGKGKIESNLENAGVPAILILREPGVQVTSFASYSQLIEIVQATPSSKALV